MEKPTLIVAGGGVSGLSAAITAASQGFTVTVLEKHSQVGGRVRIFEKQGFTFDMGPSWYWMPDVFERFFKRFGKKVADYYELERLNPSYKVFFEDGELNIPSNFEELKSMFNAIESNGGEQLQSFLEDAAYKYERGMNDLVYSPGLSVKEFLRLDLAKDFTKLQLLSSFTSLLDKYFSNEKIKMLMKFPVLFLGAKPEKTPALYSLMNYADAKLGTWYPKKGMVQIAIAMKQLAKEMGVKIITEAAVQELKIEKSRVISVIHSRGEEKVDWVISAADYHHTEQWLPAKYRNYTEGYWQKKTFSPSCLLFYVGVGKKIEGLQHHSLFFDTPFQKHLDSIYSQPEWPDNPMFYVCCPSKTDPTVAPANNENLFILTPIAAGMKDLTKEQKSVYFENFIKRIEERTGEKFRKDVLFYETFSIDDFKSEYSSFQGNAYGLANTLKQTAFMRPKIRNKRIANLFYTGQLTVPGPGLPPALISGQIVADYLKKMNDEAIV